jgi:hypothetical protein
MHSFCIGIAVFLAFAFIAIGIYYLVNPVAATSSFGLPLPDYGTNTIWWLRLKGIRDSASGLLLLAFMAWSVPRGIGLILLMQAIIPVGDMLLILAAKGSTRSALGLHATTAAVMAITAISLLTEGL